MKSKVISYLLVFFLCVSCCTQGKDEVAVVSGKWERATSAGTLRLYKVVNGNLQVRETFPVC